MNFQQHNNNAGDVVNTGVTLATVEAAKAILDKLTDEQRMEVFGNYCCKCGIIRAGNSCFDSPAENYGDN